MQIGGVEYVFFLKENKVRKDNKVSKDRRDIMDKQRT